MHQGGPKPGTGTGPDTDSGLLRQRCLHDLRDGKGLLLLKLPSDDLYSDRTTVVDLWVICVVLVSNLPYSSLSPMLVASPRISNHTGGYIGGKYNSQAFQFSSSTSPFGLYDSIGLSTD